MEQKIWRLQVILKTVERCNLACNYCYYFFMGDETYKRQPPSISRSMAGAVAEYVARGCREQRIGTVMVAFHGGEPTMQKKKDFDKACLDIKASCGPFSNVQFAIQTNAILVDDEWIDLFAEHDVAVGVSIDGPEHVNDHHRVDLRGRGSYARVREGVERLVHASNAGRIRPIGSISVINPRWNYDEIAVHLLQELGIKHQSYLLPDCSFGAGLPEGTSAHDYSRVYCELFRAWEAHPDLRIEQVDTLVERYQLQQLPGASASGSEPHPAKLFTGPAMTPGRNQIVVIQASGEVTIDDSLIPIGTLRRDLPKMNVRTNTLSEFLNTESVAITERARQTIPGHCMSCNWKGLCRGGDVENRYSVEQGFDNPSVFCTGLMTLHSLVRDYLVKNGYPVGLADITALDGGFHSIDMHRYVGLGDAQQ